MWVRHFHHVALSVPEVAVQKKFYEDFGLVGTDQTTAQRAKAVACLDPFDLFRVTALVLPMAMLGADADGDARCQPFVLQVPPRENSFAFRCFRDQGGNLGQISSSGRRESP